MLDFAIFAVTFLLALVGAVLYLYPVTAVSALTAFPTSTSLSPQRAARGGPEGGLPLPLPLPLSPPPAPRGPRFRST